MSKPRRQLIGARGVCICLEACLRGKMSRLGHRNGALKAKVQTRTEAARGRAESRRVTWRMRLAASERGGLSHPVPLKSSAARPPPGRDGDAATHPMPTGRKAGACGAGMTYNKANRCTCSHWATGLAPRPPHSVMCRRTLQGFGEAGATTKPTTPSNPDDAAQQH